jgi:hypothetical protein
VQFLDRRGDIATDDCPIEGSSSAYGFIHKASGVTRVDGIHKQLHAEQRHETSLCSVAR